MLDPITEYILEQEQLNEGFIIIPVIPGMEKIALPFVAGVIGLTAIFSAAAAISVKVKKKKFPECKKYKLMKEKEVPLFHVCVTKGKIKATKHEIIALNKLKGHCNKTKSPDKCKKDINSKILKANSRLEKLHKVLKKNEKWATERGN